jgi:hypothetical protein
MAVQLVAGPGSASGCGVKLLEAKVGSPAGRRATYLPALPE